MVILAVLGLWSLFRLERIDHQGRASAPPVDAILGDEEHRPIGHDALRRELAVTGQARQNLGIVARPVLARLGEVDARLGEHLGDARPTVLCPYLGIGNPVGKPLAGRLFDLEDFGRYPAWRPVAPNVALAAVAVEFAIHD